MRIAAPLILAAVLVGCPSPAGGAKVSLKGKELTVEWLRSDPDRMDVPRAHSVLTGDRALLVGYDGEHYLHHYSLGSDGGYDVAWLSKERKVVETASLRANSVEGITSSVEAQYALFLAPGWLKTNGVAVGETVGFGDGITSRPPEELPLIGLGSYPLKVELACTNDERQRGLMHRRRMSETHGMLFIFRRARVQSFWMLNCHFPLDIAFFDAEGKFLNMVPTMTYPDPRVDGGGRAPSQGEAKYVVETNLGWFKAKGLVNEEGKAVKPFALTLSASIFDAERRAE